MEQDTRHTDPTTQPLIHISKNSCYELSYSAAKNRVYFSILGYWKNKKSIPEFLNDWDKVLDLVTPGFSVLTDMRTMITHPQHLNTLHDQAQQKVRAKGVRKVANVKPTDKIASLQADEIAVRTDMPTQNFETLTEAEHWLDQIEA